MESVAKKVRVEDVTGKTFEFFLYMTPEGWKNKEGIKVAAEVMLRMMFNNENDITNVEQL